MIRPGGIEFTVIPRPPTSRESPLAHECSVALAANAPLTPSGSDLPVMLTMRPQPRSSMPASRWPVSWRWRVKLSVSASSHCSSEASLPNGRLPPALLTRISTAPSASVAAQAICAGASGSMKSAAITAGRVPPAASISSPSSSSAASRRAVTASRAPSWASARAIPRPMPLLAPVTSAPRSFSSRSMAVIVLAAAYAHPHADAEGDRHGSVSGPSNCTAVDVAGFDPTLILALNLAGTFVFGLSGGIAAVRARLDLFGVLVLSAVVGLAGGMTRDLLIGTPPATFRDSRYLAAAAAAGLVCFFAKPALERIARSVLVFDAFGLGLFCVTGATKAIDFGVGAVPAVLLGAITGVGGGILRDVLLREVPTVLRHELYAIPALLGAGVLVAAQESGRSSAVVPVFAAAVCVGVRRVGLKYDVNVPIAPSERY